MDSPTTTLRIEAWPDAVIDKLGFTPTSTYFEWTGNVGIFQSCEFLLLTCSADGSAVTG